MTKSPFKTGNELIDEMVEDPTMDQFYDRHPNTLTEDDLKKIVLIERKNRALYITKE